MAGTKGKKNEGTSVDPADGDFVSDVLKDMPTMPLHPLLVHPTAAMTTATVIGMGLATQMTSAWLGSLQGALDASKRLAQRVEDEAKAEQRAAEQPSGPAEDAAEAVVAAAPMVKAVTAKASKAKPAKPAAPAAAKAKPVKAAPKVAEPATEKTAKAAKASSAKVAVAKSGTSAKRSGKTGDLKVIDGIGPKLEQMLNGKGIRTVADMAALTEAEVKSLDTELGLDGRALRDDWVGQAKALGRGKK